MATSTGESAQQSGTKRKSVIDEVRGWYAQRADAHDRLCALRVRLESSVGILNRCHKDLSAHDMSASDEHIDELSVEMWRLTDTAKNVSKVLDKMKQSLRDEAVASSNLDPAIALAPSQGQVELRSSSLTTPDVVDTSNASEADGSQVVDDVLSLCDNSSQYSLHSD